MQAKETHHRNAKMLLQERWEAPLLGVFKVNTDGATFEEDNAYEVGIMICYWQGKFISGKSMKIKGSKGALRAETMAARQGLKLAIDLGIRALILEKDT